MQARRSRLHRRRPAPRSGGGSACRRRTTRRSLSRRSALGPPRPGRSATGTWRGCAQRRGDGCGAHRACPRARHAPAPDAAQPTPRVSGMRRLGRSAREPPPALLARPAAAACARAQQCRRAAGPGRTPTPPGEARRRRSRSRLAAKAALAPPEHRRWAALTQWCMPLSAPGTEQI